MPEWGQRDIHKHMHVYSSDQKDLGRIADVYEDSFLIREGLIFSKDRYIPYSAVASVANDRVQLLMSADEVQDREWSKRPDCEDHLDDPTQLMYDRGHGIHDPFDETNPTQPGQ